MGEAIEVHVHFPSISWCSRKGKPRLYFWFYCFTMSILYAFMMSSCIANPLPKIVTSELGLFFIGFCMYYPMHTEWAKHYGTAALGVLIVELAQLLVVLEIRNEKTGPFAAGVSMQVLSIVCWIIGISWHAFFEWLGMFLTLNTVSVIAFARGAPIC